MFFKFFSIISLINILLFSYEAKDFSYLVGKTTCIDDKTLNLHLKLYQGYVKNINELISLLKEMDQNNDSSSIIYSALKRRFGFEFDGMRLHELYFENIGSSAPIKKESKIYQEIEREFKSFENFKQSFLKTAMTRGIGWVVLYKDLESNALFNVWINEHEVSHLVKGVPLLVLDVWEHAFITQYGLEKARYLDAFLKDVNWDVVDKRVSSK